MYKTETPNWHLNMAERHAEKLAQENKELREMLEIICSRLNEDRVDTTGIDADLLRGQKLLNRLGDDE